MRRFRSFDLFRRNQFRSEFVTFDELSERARFIVEAEAQPVESWVSMTGQLNDRRRRLLLTTQGERCQALLRDTERPPSSTALETKADGRISDIPESK